MKAFIHKCDKDGKDLGLGTFNNWVSNEYLNMSNLIHHTFKDVSPGIYRVEAFDDWSNRYGKCDVEKMVTLF